MRRPWIFRCRTGPGDPLAVRPLSLIPLILKSSVPEPMPGNWPMAAVPRSWPVVAAARNRAAGLGGLGDGASRAGWMALPRTGIRGPLSLAAGQARGTGGVLTVTGRPLVAVRRSVLLLPGAGPLRARRRHVRQAQRRALDGGHEGGQRRAGVRGGLASLVLLLASRGGGGQSVTHRAQPAASRPRLEDAVCRVEHEDRTDNGDNEQASHEFPVIS